MTPPMKRIIVCCDGTWNSADTQTTDTNVALMARSIHASQETGGVLQIVLYLRGVGTTGLHFETVFDAATGHGIDDNVRSAYMFIAQNYLPGDEIFLFGFSRGAYTARSLAGFIAACGVLKRQKLGDLVLAWNYYRGPRPHSPQDFKQSRHTDCHVDATIKFLGVWDTVGSLGIPGPLFAKLNQQQYGFLDTGPSSVVKRGCHAMAIEEHRAEFIPTPWTGTAPAGVRIEQVWFAGAHSDVGGGYATRALADIPLVWMAKKAEEEGLALDWFCLPDPNNLDPLAPIHRLAHAHLRGGPHKADMAGDAGSAGRQLIRPVAARSFARSCLRAGRRARKAARRHQRVDPRERRPALWKSGAGLRRRRDRRQQAGRLAAQKSDALLRRQGGLETGNPSFGVTA